MSTRKDRENLTETGYTGALSDMKEKWLIDEGYDDINGYLKGQGYTGATSDMIKQKAVEAGYSSVSTYLDEVGLYGNQTGPEPAPPFYDYEIQQSARFDLNSSPSLDRTFASGGNQQTWTLSTWFKRGRIVNGGIMIGRQSSAYNTPFVLARILGDDIDFFRWNGSSSAAWSLATKQVFRDPSSWYHIVFVLDTTNATASERARIYVNGKRVTDFTTANYPSLNSSWEMNYPGGPHSIGMEGYLSEYHFVDGQALTADAFGEFKTGIWVPKQYTGGYGNTGFYLDFADGGHLGNDANGTNDFTDVNLYSFCQVPDSPTNNFATLNPIASYVGTYDRGNLRVDTGSGTYPTIVSSMAMSSGKWYCEYYLNQNVSTGGAAIGIVKASTLDPDTNIYDANNLGLGYYTGNGYIYDRTDGTFSGSAYGSSYTTGDIIGVAYDADNSQITFYKNGVEQGTYTPKASIDEAYFACGEGVGTTNAIFTANFGQDDTFWGNAVATGYTDSNGKGIFRFQPPDGYLALCNSNLPEPLISPARGDSPSDYFVTALYSGNAGTVNVTGLEFKPDLVWQKRRDSAGYHFLTDVVRGEHKTVFTNSTQAEYNYDPYGLTSFNADGFTYYGASEVNRSGSSNVAWNWKAGGTPVTNTKGTITSSVSANVNSGFSIISYTGTAAVDTIGHGLPSAPALLIFKRRTDTVHWCIVDVKNQQYGHFTTGNFGGWSYVLNGVNDSVITLPSSSSGGYSYTNYGNREYICYAFSDVEGYSKVGNYVGNGSANGPFVYCGFRPAFVMAKRTDSSTQGWWYISDDERNTYNDVDHELYADLSDAEATAERMDYLSNGFKIRTTNGMLNASGGTYIYIAFAENPFKYSNAR